MVLQTYLCFFKFHLHISFVRHFLWVKNISSIMNILFLLRVICTHVLHGTNPKATIRTIKQKQKYFF